MTETIHNKAKVSKLVLFFIDAAKQYRVLLVKSTKCWSFPGGKSQLGELPVQTCDREVREELRTEPNGLLECILNVKQTIGASDKSVQLYACQCMEDDSVHIQKNGEILELAWVPLDQITIYTMGFWKSDLLYPLIKDFADNHPLCPYCKLTASLSYHSVCGRTGCHRLVCEQSSFSTAYEFNEQGLQIIYHNECFGWDDDD